MIHRVPFMSDKETYINADLNGAYQIMKKAPPIRWYLSSFIT